MSDEGQVINDAELKALLNFFIVLGGDIEKIVAKGSLSLLDLPGLYGAFSAASSALSGIKQLPGELSQINDASLADLRSYIASGLPGVLPNAEVDGLINSGLSLGQELFDFIVSLKGAKASAPVSAPVPPAS